MKVGLIPHAHAVETFYSVLTHGNGYIIGETYPNIDSNGVNYE